MEQTKQLPKNYLLAEKLKLSCERVEQLSKKCVDLYVENSQKKKINLTLLI